MKKTAQTRLMDLLAGWVGFLNEEENGGAEWTEPEVTEAVHDLYEKIGKRDDLTEGQLLDALDEIREIVRR